LAVGRRSLFAEAEGPLSPKVEVRFDNPERMKEKVKKRGVKGQKTFF